MGQSVATVNDFQKHLQFSEEASAEPFWEAVYRKAFPNMVGMLLCSGDTDGQRRGVDRLVYLSNDRVLRIDEKKRQKDYPDILLEYLSVDTTGAPGWMEKDLAIDYLAYAFMPTRRVYLFDWLMLRRAWVQFKDEWKQKYPKIEAKNATYKTHSVAVPIQIVRQSVYLARLIQV